MNRKEYEERIAKLEKELKELKEAEITNDEFPQYDEIYTTSRILKLVCGF